jgi:HPt (histidine-containing phosphotransfer) domain-containing protein
MTDSEIIDTAAQARLREWGGIKLLSQMIRLFLENAPTRIEQTRKGVTEGNVREAERGVHSLKSSAANVGAMRVSRLAAQMEDMAARGELGSVAGLMQSLETEFAAASDQLATILKASPEPEV